MGAKRKDITGKTFGRLYIERNDESNPNYVICKCECGNIKRIRKDTITRKNKPVHSCGCIKKEAARDRVLKYGHNINENCKMSRKYGTNFGIIERCNHPGKRNKSGHVGVCLNKRGKYEAYIGVNKSKMYLGCFDKIQDAIDARREAEEIYFAPLIEAKNAELGFAI